MTFKRSIFASLVFSLLAAPLQAVDIQAYPLGIVLRPSLIQRVFDRINGMESGIPMNACLKDFNWGLNAQAKLKLSQPRWLNSTEESLALSGSIDSLEIEGKLYKSCDSESKGPDLKSEVLASGSLELRSRVELQFIVNLWELHHDGSGRPVIELTAKSFESLVSSFKASLSPEGSESDQNALNQMIQAANAEQLLMGSLIQPINKILSGWLEDRLRGLAYVDYIANVFEKNELWKEGVQVKTGAVSITNPGERLRQSELAFGFYPRRDRFVVLGNGSLQLYFNSVFLDRSQMSSLVGEEISDNTARASIARDRLLSGTELNDPSFKRPQIKPVNSDVSLVLPEALINGALARIYEQDLRRFTTEIKFGEQASGLITEEPVDVSLRVQLESDQAPKLLFESNTLNLSVSDYFLSIGTFIEDRLIPSTQVRAQVDVRAGLDVSGATVNLSVEPSTFRIGLEEGQRFASRFSGDDLRFVEGVTNEIWKEFFTRYPKLPLFYTIFKKEDSEIEIVNLEVQDDFVLLHFNFEEIPVGL